jgi:hypothetical protein
MAVKQCIKKDCYFYNHKKTNLCGSFMHEECLKSDCEEYYIERKLLNMLRNECNLIKYIKKGK